MSVKRFPGKGLGLVATADLQVGDVVMKIPSEVSIKPSLVLKNFPDWKTLHLPNSSLVVLFLAVERFHLHENTWTNMLLSKPRKLFGPFTETLRDCVNEMTFSRKERRQFEQLCNSRMMGRQQMVELLETLKKSGFTSQAFPVTLEQLLWASCRHTSRSWMGDLMIPVADLFNHDRNNYNAALAKIKTSKTDESMDNFVEGDHGIQIVRPVKKGEEVLISYGNKSSCEMIGVYGFIEPVSEHSNIALHLPPPPSQAHKLLAGIVTPRGVRLSWKGFDPSSATALRIFAEPKSLDSYFFSRVYMKPQEWVPDEGNEARLLDLLSVSANLNLASFVDYTELRKVKSFQEGIAIVVKEVSNSRPMFRPFLEDCFGMLSNLLASLVQNIEAMKKQ